MSYSTTNDCAHEHVEYEVGESRAVGSRISTVHRFDCAGCDACARVVMDAEFTES